MFHPYSWLQSIGLIPRTEIPKAPPQAPASPSPEEAGLPPRVFGLMATVSGRMFDVLNPNPAEVSLDEIAHGLSQINRFNGHTRFPYSVAQHAELCARECLRRYPGMFEAALAVLHHDSAEAYLGDVIRPIKGLIGPVYRQLESRVQAAIHRQFEIRIDAATTAVIHECDNAVVRTEAHELMIGSDKWNWGTIQPAPVRIEEIAPHEAKARFMAMHYRLMEDAERFSPTIPFRPALKAQLASPAVAV